MILFKDALSTSLSQQWVKCIEKDLILIGLPSDFTLRLRPENKTYDAKYDPNTKVVTIYGNTESYETFRKFVVHEAIHHWQWNYDLNFSREKGVMHDEMFWVKFYFSMGMLMYGKFNVKHITKKRC